ncbi:MAG: hypothetical protein IT287_01135 [Bdellovibrionaceae bacterium]|nr:hypothetical protein [Pseudobdellovibrionaceae bacterium]
MNHFRSFAFLVLLIGCSFYSYWLSNKDFEWVVPYMEERTPAAVRESPDYKSLIDKPLRVFKRDAIAGSIDVRSKDKKYHVSFGQFATKGNKGPNLMCIEYPFIKLKLQGEGVAVGGKKAELFVIVPCKTHAKNTDMVNDIEIPFEELYRKPAQDVQFTYQQQNYSSEIYLKNVFGNWPKQWQVESIHFLRDTNDIQSDANEKISNEEILKERGEPILIYLNR